MEHHGEACFLIAVSSMVAASKLVAQGNLLLCGRIAGASMAASHLREFASLAPYVSDVSLVRAQCVRQYQSHGAREL